MKKIKLALLLLINILPAVAYTDNNQNKCVLNKLDILAASESQNGGENEAALFTSCAYKIYDEIKSSPQKIQILTEKQLELFYESLKNTRVDAVEGPIRDNSGKIVDARVIDDPSNTGNKLIEIDKNIWGGLFNKQANVSIPVFHEYLRTIKGINDNNYQISFKLGIETGTIPITPIVLPDDSETSLYQRLEQIFNISITPNIVPLLDYKKYFAGYCFTKGNPNNRLGGILLGYPLKDNLLGNEVRLLHFLLRSNSDFHIEGPAWETTEVYNTWNYYKEFAFQNVMSAKVTSSGIYSFHHEVSQNKFIRDLHHNLRVTLDRSGNVVLVHSYECAGSCEDRVRYGYEIGSKIYCYYTKQKFRSGSDGKIKDDLLP